MLLDGLSGCDAINLSLYDYDEKGKTNPQPQSHVVYQLICGGRRRDANEQCAMERDRGDTARHPKTRHSQSVYRTQHSESKLKGKNMLNPAPKQHPSGAMGCGSPFALLV